MWHTDELRRPLILMTGVFTLSFNFSVLLPLLAQKTFHGNADALGVLSAMVGVGSLLGALTVANRDRTPTMHRLAVFSVVTGVALVVSGLAPNLPLAAAAMIPVGFTVMAFMITGNTVLQLHARPQARGRVMALYGVVFLGSTPIGGSHRRLGRTALRRRRESDGWRRGGHAVRPAGAEAARAHVRHRVRDDRRPPSRCRAPRTPP